MLHIRVVGGRKSAMWVQSAAAHEKQWYSIKKLRVYLIIFLSDVF